MWILIDFDNLDRPDRHQGPETAVLRVLNKIEAACGLDARSINVRLYGGWYHGPELSRRAEELSDKIGQAFPLARMPDGSTQGKTMINAQLALSLLIDPTVDLIYTYRPRGISGIKCVDPPFPRCANPSFCALKPVHEFLADKVCVNPACEVRTKDVLYRAEQKLVDSMIISDLIHVAGRGESVAVVSSDDDMWPGIRHGLAMGQKIVHVHTRPGQRTPEEYLENIPPNYIQIGA